MLLHHAKKRIASAIEEIDRLMQSEFPSQHPKDAICILREKFEHSASVLERIDPNICPEIVRVECNASLERLFVYVPILGFILRSTNVRNGFEAYVPLLRLAESLIGDNTKLIVSSEWEFSPFTYYNITDLPGFVLIGIPATESSNPLIVPLAGHELGHSVWKTLRVADAYKGMVRKAVLDEIRNKQWAQYREKFPQCERKEDLEEDMYIQRTWEPARQWAMLQIEEIFCDIMGVRLFAESYLHAFSYLLAPGNGSQRSLRYPKITKRILLLRRAAEALKVDIPQDFTESFLPEDDPTDPTTAFLVSIADTVSESCFPDLLHRVQQIADTKKIPIRDVQKVGKIADRFKKWVVPTTEYENLVDILCAAWKCSLDQSLWEHIPQLRRTAWERVLRDLAYKSMEVSEVYLRLQKAGVSTEAS